MAEVAGSHIRVINAPTMKGAIRDERGKLQFGAVRYVRTEQRTVDGLPIYDARVEDPQ